MPDPTVKPHKSDAENRNNTKCSFCRKSYLEVDILISAPKGVYICGSCVDECSELVKGYREAHDN